jgi:hypothetical protein
VGSLGTAHTERGLTFLEVELSGHMYVAALINRRIAIHDPVYFRVPQFSPLVSCSFPEYFEQLTDCFRIGGLPKHAVPHGIPFNTLVILTLKTLKGTLNIRSKYWNFEPDCNDYSYVGVGSVGFSLLIRIARL